MSFGPAISREFADLYHPWGVWQRINTETHFNGVLYDVIGNVKNGLGSLIIEPVYEPEAGAEIFDAYDGEVENVMAYDLMPHPDPHWQLLIARNMLHRLRWGVA